MPGAIDIRDLREGVTLVTFRGVASDEEFRAYLDSMSRRLERRRSSVLVMDASEALRTPPKQRRLQAEWLRAHRSELRRYSRGSAFVITSPLVRGVLTAILWIAPMEGPYTVVGTLAEAERWAEEQLRRAA